ncbi:kinase-like protein [Melanomma pulvis-pyrius CBS 109.77]|uniref:non-specific serine/threonine protein kinase n=1 Tax=Melanomma pulvis-pyrius CBS 109.77 TaxID=1314802 RepID=A0A6A6XGB8_9PLEO|nr:kinase-like protein [Melanomma pulvis-pyrius CBS 109.77]
MRYRFPGLDRPVRGDDYSPLDVLSNLSKEFKVVRQQGRSNGGCNAGIVIVRRRKTGDVCVEKKFSRRQFHLVRDEIDVLMQLQGIEYMVQMVGSFIDNKTSIASIIFEACDWGAMDTLIDRHALAKQSIYEVWVHKVFAQMSFALEFLHYGPPNPGSSQPPWKAILHLDLKPGNILLKAGSNSMPDIVVADFGSAFGGQTNCVGSGCRTPDFMPPEQTISEAADIWSVGTILLCLCQLQRYPTLDKEGYLDRDIDRHYTETLSSTIYGCMRTNPKDRYSSKDMAQRARRILESTNEPGDFEYHGVLPIPPRIKNT